MITTFENICVLEKYFIVLRPIFDTTYKGKNRSKYTCVLYIMNCSYSKKLGIFFAMYQRMRLKGASWAGPRLLPSYFIPFLFYYLLTLSLSHSLIFSLSYFRTFLNLLLSFFLTFLMSYFPTF